MTVKLNEKDKRMLQGEYGKATKLAMSILVRMAEVYGAEEMMDVALAHIDGVGLLSEASLEFAETLATLGGRVAIPTTLNMVPLDIQQWEKWKIPEDYAHRALRQIRAYINMGCIPTCTCAPYQGYLTPRFGQQIAWAESNAIVYANSVLGARTNRYGDYIDICAAITGRVPKYGLHLKANRRGQLLLRLVDIEPAWMKSDTFYPLLGHFLGRTAGDKIPVIEGLPAQVTDDQLKALGAAAASSGAVALFHAVGVTPEAHTLEEAFQNEPPEGVIDVHPDDLVAAQKELSTAEADAPLDAVVLGCPHFSFTEFQQLAQIIQAQGGQSIHSGVQFVVLTNQLTLSLLQRSNLITLLTSFGIQIVLDTCDFHCPILHSETKVIMTNSGKQAYYAPGELGVQVALGTMADCVRSAIKGRVVRSETPWTES
ncbi:MAG: aconitase X catalytic domain-containing protein [Chloroflexi bacterium]|nr:aconitase X catalytic domain-containing protein [Chloroflexota bacterium]